MIFDDHRGVDPGGRRRPIVLDLEPRDELPPLARVRQWIAAALADLADEHIHAAQQVATELVTNAWAHGGGTRQVRLGCDRWPCRVRIEVDDVATNEPADDGRQHEMPRGRGLVLVDEFATEWGVSSWTCGKTVWAQIDCDENPRIKPCKDRHD